MEALILAKTVFYSVVSLAIIVLGILFTLATYEIVKITENLRKVTESLSSLSKDTEEKIKEMIDNLSQLPILSFFMKKNPHKTANQKGRNNK